MRAKANHDLATVYPALNVRWGYQECCRSFQEWFYNPVHLNVRYSANSQFDAGAAAVQVLPIAQTKKKIFKTTWYDTLGSLGISLAN